MCGIKDQDMHYMNFHQNRSHFSKQNTLRSMNEQIYKLTHIFTWNENVTVYWGYRPASYIRKLQYLCPYKTISEFHVQMNISSHKYSLDVVWSVLSMTVSYFLINPETCFVTLYSEVLLGTVSNCTTLMKKTFFF
jgi:hypothetical protein